MELICPSCEACYRVPDNAIGANGRRVSCTDCGHEWQAFPPAILSSTAAAPPAATDPARRQQFAEIRGMLDEVQSGEDAVPAAARQDEDRPGSAMPSSPDGTAHPAGAEPRNTETPRHHTAAQDGMEERPGRGSAFLSGFLLVVTIGAVLIAIFLLRPQIVALIPAAGPIMTGYVEAVNTARIAVTGWLDTAQIAVVGWLDAAQIVALGWLDAALAWFTSLTGGAAGEAV